MGHGSSMQPTAEDRRLHPRRAVRQTLTLEPAGGSSITCESVDVSVGGMKVRSRTRIPLGPADVVISADGDDVLSLHGDVVEEIIDASTGEITARIVFSDRTVAAAPTPRRRGLAVLAGALVAGLVVAGGAYVASRSGDDAERPASVPAASTSPSVATGPAPIDAPPRVTPSPATTTPTAAPSVSAPPAPRPSATPPPPAPAAGTQAPAPAAPASRVEHTDDLTRVVVGETAEDTSVRTTTRPSPEGDDVRMQLSVTPEPDGTTLPVSVRIENRSSETLRFFDGLRVTVTADRDGASAATAMLASDVREVAPGESVTVDGFLDFGATGEYDVSATTTVG